MSFTSAADAGGQVGPPVQVQRGQLAPKSPTWRSSLIQTQRERVEVLRDAAAVLDARLEEALALGRRLGPKGHIALHSGPDLTQMRPASKNPPRTSGPTETDTTLSGPDGPQTGPRASELIETATGSQVYEPQTAPRSSGPTDASTSQAYGPQTASKLTPVTPSAEPPIRQPARAPAESENVSTELLRDGCSQPAEEGHRTNIFRNAALGGLHNTRRYNRKVPFVYMETERTLIYLYLF